MPEGPEVQRYADEIAAGIVGQKVLSVSARTKDARAWIEANPAAITGRKVTAVQAHGKNIIGWFEGGFYFYSHQMMWGRWSVFSAKDAPPVDKLERARITTKKSVAILRSAPIFKLGEGDPYKNIEYLQEIGPDCLPGADADFNSAEFLKRLKKQKDRPIGSALLDQSVVAGIGNYLRAEILFEARMDPWKLVGELKTADFKLLAMLVPKVTARAYATGGVTITDELVERMMHDPLLVYVPGKEYGRRHYVFRRTNLPCLVCATPVSQKRQSMARAGESEEESLSRIVYFCSKCQNVPIEAKVKKRKQKA